MMFTNLVLAICSVGLLFFLVILVRNEIIYCYEMKALDITRERVDRAAGEGKPWIHFYDEYNQVECDRMDFRKWTFKHFYPGWED